MSCLFCRIARHQSPAEIVYEDDEVVAFRDLHPQAPEHLLCIPRRHLATLNEAEPAEAQLLGRLLLTAQRLAKELGFAGNGYRLVMNCNRDGGQTVYHLHLHVLAGRALRWPPG